MKFNLSHERILELGSSALITLNQFKQIGNVDKEAGGMLLGRVIEGSRDIIIDEVTPPHPADPRSRFTYFRKRKPAQKIVDQAWENSQGTHNYLGEWHSHPEPYPNPSSEDIRNWKRIGENAKYEQDFLIFIILGTCALRVWILLDGELKELKQG